VGGFSRVKGVPGQKQGVFLKQPPWIVYGKAKRGDEKRTVNQKKEEIAQEQSGVLSTNGKTKGLIKKTEEGGGKKMGEKPGSGGNKKCG